VKQILNAVNTGTFPDVGFSAGLEEHLNECFECAGRWVLAMVQVSSAARQRNDKALWDFHARMQDAIAFPRQQEDPFLDALLGVDDPLWDDEDRFQLLQLIELKLEKGLILGSHVAPICDAVMNIHSIAQDVAVKDRAFALVHLLRAEHSKK